MVEIDFPVLIITPHHLQVTVLQTADAHLLPARRYHERLDTLDLQLVIQPLLIINQVGIATTIFLAVDIEVVILDIDQVC